jgi:hypothetical protein
MHIDYPSKNSGRLKEKGPKFRQNQLNSINKLKQNQLQNNNECKEKDGHFDDAEFDFVKKVFSGAGHKHETPFRWAPIVIVSMATKGTTSI